MNKGDNLLERGLAGLGALGAWLAAIIQGLVLSFVVIPVLLAAVLGGVLLLVWQWARPIFQGDRLLFTTYYQRWRPTSR